MAFVSRESQSPPCTLHPSPSSVAGCARPMHDIRSAAGRGTVRKPHIADELAMPCGADGKLRALAVQSTLQYRLWRQSYSTYQSIVLTLRP